VHVAYLRTQAKPLVEGLTQGLWQGFKTYDEAITDYFNARGKDWDRVIRLPGDSNAIFGLPDKAEDL
jgi:hypothetical protein